MSNQTASSVVDLAVMFMDVADAVQLYATLGDSFTVAEIERRLTIGRKSAEAFGGEVIKTTGKGLLIVFKSAEAAFDAAFEMQSRVADLTPASKKVITIRVGIHAGPVVREQGDVFGDTVNVAARICDLAAAGQTLAAASTREQLPARLRELSRGLGPFSLKGKSEPISIFQFATDLVDDMTLMTRARVPRFSTSLELAHAGKEWRLNVLRPIVTIGRSAEADVVVVDPQASRLHARIELKNGKFVLADQSTNGTTVKIGDAAEVELHREETILHSEGSIWCGRARVVEAGVKLRFKVTAAAD